MLDLVLNLIKGIKHTTLLFLLKKSTKLEAIAFLSPLLDEVHNLSHLLSVVSICGLCYTVEFYVRLFLLEDSKGLDHIFSAVENDGISCKD